MLYCQVNGQQTNILSVNDRGFAYGDGIFTTGKITAGCLELCDEHLSRLKFGCSKLQITSPDWLKLGEDLRQIAVQYQTAVMKVIITAGQGGRGYSRFGTGEPNVIIQVHAFPEHYALWARQGITLGICEQKLGLNPMLAGIKHLNRLEQVLIRQELDLRSEDDVLVVNLRDEIVETSCSNVFWQQDGRWFTPELSDSGVRGLARAGILAKLAAVQVKASLSALDKINAMFICNAVMGVVPVRVFNHRELDISPVLALESDFS
ncbi:aminodeoxychorismate lyase [Thalassomonas haliotis]|uniref:Aminodeoxychorismate lyase n=1 Tax=Thalassomonas haliotis TaxID=485448 RepID=A0ABY7V8B9_9GAMM|nr:aminodeoxychorismate lyase [Thalassomonas haliotis]WDE09796.1 aminodeoxychorismate lyase [Thalassomonas haliotis]